MHDEDSLLQKTSDFMQAFLEFLGRPKTIFDIKDRFRLLVLLAVVIAALELVIFHFKNVK